jgi:hypothetical protein
MAAAFFVGATLLVLLMLLWALASCFAWSIAKARMR